MNKNITIALTGVVLVALVFLVYMFKLDRNEVEEMQISSFEECVAAGNRVAESYPRQCTTATGEHFVEEITPAPTPNPTPTPAPITQNGRITGSVTLGPTCPGPVSDPPKPGCEDKPLETRLILLKVGSTQVIREFSSDSRGQFTLDVPAGTYMIRRADSVSPTTFPQCSSGTFTVLASKSVSVAVSCDTGMR